jgi:hypothetical protein
VAYNAPCEVTGCIPLEQSGKGDAAYSQPYITGNTPWSGVNTLGSEVNLLGFTAAAFRQLATHNRSGTREGKTGDTKDGRRL